MTSIIRYIGHANAVRCISSIVLIMTLLMAIMAPLGCQLFRGQDTNNHAPFAPSVAITPSLPATGDDLSCVITTPSTDPDGDEVSYSYQWYKDEELQSELTSNIVGAEHTNVGEVWKCVVTPNDGTEDGESARAEVTIHSEPSPDNNPPELSPIGDQSVSEGELLIFTVSATDPDSDTLSYSASDLPAGADLSSSTGAFSWTPDYDQAGSYEVTFLVTDGNDGSDSETITITVSDVLPTADSTTVGALELATSFQCISVYSNFSGDDNGNNSAVLEYREVGDSTWKQGMAMTGDRRDELMLYGSGTISNAYKNQWRALVLWLEPDTEYEVRITYTDPDGFSGSSAVSATTSTRDDDPASNGNTYYVSTTGDDGNNGSFGNPWRTIQYAADIVQAGDQVLVMPGTYNERVTITCSGEEDNYITFRSYDMDNKAVVSHSDRGTFRLEGASRIRIKGFEVQNTTYATIHLTDASADNIIEDNVLSSSGTDWWAGGVVVAGGSANTLIQRNEISTTVTEGQPMGMLLYETGGGTVIRANSIIGGFYDGIGGAPNFGIEGGPYRDSYIYDNYVEGSRDDGIEAEGGGINCAVWGNTIQDCNTMSLGIAPVIVGPMYVFRNTLIAASDAAVKMGSSSSGYIYFYHNTIYSPDGGDKGIATYGNNAMVYNAVFRNNIIYSAGYSVEELSSGTGAMDFDYNCMYSNRGNPIKWLNSQMSWADWRTDYGQESNGIWGQPDFADPGNDDFELLSTSNCIDEGTLLQGFNDAESPWPYQGDSPDMGAYEFDAA